MKKFFLIFVGVVLLLGGGAVYYVMNMDWNKHKDTIANQFHELTGKYVKLDGNVTLKIFPAPYLNVSNAKIFSQPASKTPILTIKNAMADLDLLSLLKGSVKVEKMVLDGAVINVDLTAKQIKWQNDLTADQRAMFENNKNILSSISLKNAEVNFQTQNPENSIKLTKLNGEVTTDSLFGPFRIEGNYLKGNSPEGFALSIGTIVENMPTSLNAVISHPNSNSFLRFDGTVNLNNMELKGGFILESVLVGDFINENLGKEIISDEYNGSVNLGFDATINSDVADFTNVVVKYGDTQGAGSLFIPYGETEDKTIVANFDFAELEVDPFVKLMRNYVETYSKQPYNPDFAYDVSANISAVKALYEEQGLKNLKTKIELKNNVINVNEFKVVLPGDTSVAIDGKISSKDGEPIYRANLFVEAVDLLKTLQWLNINPEQTSGSVYKKMILDTKVDGNLDRIQFLPYKVTLDKTTLTGNARLILKDKKYLMLIVNGDTINLDNYLAPLDKEAEEKTWLSRAVSRLAGNDILKSLDLIMDLNANLIIYESMPFERVAFKLKMLDGKLNIEEGKIDEVANTSVLLKGEISGFDGALNFSNLNYDFKSKDLMSFINKFELETPALNYKELNDIEIRGILNGTFDNFGISTNINVGDLDAIYEGTAVKVENVYDFDGKVEAKYPEFNKLLQNFNLKYVPTAPNLGIFNFKSDIKGNADNMTFSNMEGNIGYTSFAGDMTYVVKDEKDSIDARLNINTFEIERFLVRNPNVKNIIAQKPETDVSFLAKPVMSEEKFDYAPYMGIDFNGVFEVGELSYKGRLFKDSKFRLVSANNEISVNDFTANYKNADVDAQAKLKLTSNPEIAFVGKIENANIVDFPFGGRDFGSDEGEFSLNADIVSSAASKNDFINNLTGKLDFNIVNAGVRGMDLAPVYDDLLVRTSGVGLNDVVVSYIGAGNMSFERISGQLEFDKGNFNLQNTSMENEREKVGVSGGGNITDWSMGVLFNVKFKEAEYLPPLLFGLNGEMNDPELEINIADIQKMYVDRDNEKKAMEQAEIEAEKKYWQELIDEQKAKADALLARVRQNIDAKVDAKTAEAFVPENTVKYETLKKEAADVIATLIEKVNSVDVNTTKVDDEVIAGLAEANKTSEEKIASIEQKIDAIYLEDMKKQYDVEYAKIVEINNLLKQRIFDYNAVLSKYDERLKSFETDYKMREDEEFKSFNTIVEEQIGNLEKYVDESVKINELSQADVGISFYEENNSKLKEIYLKLQEIEEILTENIKKPEEIVLPKIDAAEEAYNKSVREAEEKRKIEENTGSISVKKTGKTITVTRDIEEIEEAEDKISNEEIKVLDFTAKKDDEKKDAETSESGVIKKGKNIISF